MAEIVVDRTKNNHANLLCNTKGPFVVSYSMKKKGESPEVDLSSQVRISTLAELNGYLQTLAPEVNAYFADCREESKKGIVIEIPYNLLAFMQRAFDVKNTFDLACNFEPESDNNDPLVFIPLEDENQYDDISLNNYNALKNERGALSAAQLLELIIAYVDIASTELQINPKRTFSEYITNRWIYTRTEFGFKKTSPPPPPLPLEVNSLRNQLVVAIKAKAEQLHADGHGKKAKRILNALERAQRVAQNDNESNNVTGFINYKSKKSEVFERHYNFMASSLKVKASIVGRSF